MTSPNDFLNTGSLPLFPVVIGNISNSDCLSTSEMLLNSKFAGLIHWHHNRALSIVSAVNVKKYGFDKKQTANGQQGWIDLVAPEHHGRLLEHLGQFYLRQLRGAEPSAHVVYDLINGDSRHTVRQETFGQYGKDGKLLTLKSLIVDLASSAGPSELEQENLSLIHI